MDVFIASTAILLLLPLMMLIVVLIWISMGRPIFFSHPRIGLNRRVFRCIKFRTMVSDTEEALARHLRESPEAAEEWLQTNKLRNDPRITSLGQILRKSSLDELPQLLNVLRGEMSCIGPRPIVTAELERYGASAEDYLRARPGLTGVWQVSGRSRLAYNQRVALDSYYVRNWSVWLDVTILIKTVPALLSFDETF